MLKTDAILMNDNIREMGIFGRGGGGVGDWKRQAGRQVGKRRGGWVGRGGGGGREVTEDIPTARVGPLGAAGFRGGFKRSFPGVRRVQVYGNPGVGPVLLDGSCRHHVCCCSEENCLFPSLVGGQGGKGGGGGGGEGRGWRRRRRGGGLSRSLVLFENVELRSGLSRMLRALFIWHPRGGKGKEGGKRAGLDWRSSCSAVSGDEEKGDRGTRGAREGKERGRGEEGKE